MNGGSLYVQSDEAVTSHGWIAKTVNWDDVSDPQVLLEKAREYLADLQFDNLELELSALDLHYLDVETEAVKRWTRSGSSPVPTGWTGSSR